MNPAEAEATRLQAENDQLRARLLEAAGTLIKLQATVDELGAAIRRLHDDNRLQQTRQEIKQW